MAEDTSPPVDSRQPGFDPERDAAIAAEQAASSPPPPPAPPAPKVTPTVPRTLEAVLADIEAWVRSEHGSHPRFEELWAELQSVL